MRGTMECRQQQSICTRSAHVRARARGRRRRCRDSSTAQSGDGGLLGSVPWVLLPVGIACPSDEEEAEEKEGAVAIAAAAAAGPSAAAAAAAADGCDAFMAACVLCGGVGLGSQQNDWIDRGSRLPTRSLAYRSPVQQAETTVESCELCFVVEGGRTAAGCPVSPPTAETRQRANN